MRIFIVLLVIIILGGGYWFANREPAGINVTLTPETPAQNTVTPTPPTPSTPTETTIEVDGSVTSGTVKEIVVTNAGMAFTTKTLSVKKGDRVKITYKNAGGTHDFRIDGYNVGTKVIQAGQEDSFEFVADTAGTFEYFCSVGNHRAMGMKGTLTVTN